MSTSTISNIGSSSPQLEVQKQEIQAKLNALNTFSKESLKDSSMSMTLIGDSRLVVKPSEDQSSDVAKAGKEEQALKSTLADINAKIAEEVNKEKLPVVTKTGSILDTNASNGNVISTYA